VTHFSSQKGRFSTCRRIEIGRDILARPGRKKGGHLERQSCLVFIHTGVEGGLTKKTVISPTSFESGEGGGGMVLPTPRGGPSPLVDDSQNERGEGAETCEGVLTSCDSNSS